ncbi:MAG: TetR family transcriptional regulator [Actinomycetota bacterium]
MELDGNGVPGGLRDRKKSETRDALRAAALRLFRDRGFAAVSVDQIAAEANVSRSTFFRYFGSKEAVLFNDIDEVGGIFLEEIRGRPSTEGAADAFEHALLAISRHSASRRTQDQQRALDDLLRTDPALSARRMADLARWAEAIAGVFAERAGREEPTFADRLAASTCMQVTEEIARAWREDDSADAAHWIKEAFRVLRSF